jgi:hypothetical protein
MPGLLARSGPHTEGPLNKANALGRQSSFRATSKPAASDAAPREQLKRMLDAQITDEEQAEIASHKADEAKFTERTQLTPRNAPCTCGSGEKYKRCCGKNASAVPRKCLQSLKDPA